MSVRDTIRNIKPVVVEFLLKDGSKVWLRALTGLGRAQFHIMMEHAKENGGVKAEVVAAMAICETDGTMTYDWNNADDLKDLLSLDGQDLDAIGVQLFTLSGLTKESQERAEKN